jgi:hypothetical protein
MFVWKTYKWIVLCLLLTSCPPEDECWEPALVSVGIYSGDSNIVRSYIYAYGLGRESQKVYPGFLNYYSYKGDSSNGAFVLELDLNHDACGFCLVKKDLSVDTFILAYTRQFYADRRCDGCYISEKRIKWVSSGFILDSSYIGTEGSYYKLTPEVILKK